MGNSALKTVAGSDVVAAEKDPKTFPGMLRAFQGEIARALPKHLNADRMARMALTCFRDTPKLADCAPASIFACVIKAAQLGLEPGLNGRAFLIPYQGECQLVPGWKGLLELANRTGRAAAWTGAVFRGDDFDYQLGDSPHVTHRPGLEDAVEFLIYTYAIGRVKGNEWPIVEVWTNEKILRHRDRYNKVGKKHYSYDNWEMYARKIPLMQVIKYLPSSPELEAAIALDYAVERGERQGLTIEGVLSGAEYVPPPAADTSTDDKKTGAAKDEFTFADVASEIAAALAAKSVEQLDLARDLIRQVKDPKHQVELNEQAEQARADIAKPEKA